MTQNNTQQNKTNNKTDEPKEIPNISSIERFTREEADFEPNPEFNDYSKNVKIWFENGAAIRFQDNGDTIKRAIFRSDDPHSVWTGHTLCKSSGSNVHESATIFLEHLTEFDTLDELDGIFGDDVIKTLSE